MNWLSSHQKYVMSFRDIFTTLYVHIILRFYASKHVRYVHARIEYSVDKLITIKHEMHVKHEFLNSCNLRVRVDFYESTIPSP